MATHLIVRQGTTQNIDIADIKDANGALINPTGCSVRGHVRASVDSATVLHEWTSTGGSPNATITTGKVTLALTPAVTAAWAWTAGEYDVELTDAAGQVARIAEGHITVSREVTR